MRFIKSQQIKASKALKVNLFEASHNLFGVRLSVGDLGLDNLIIDSICGVDLHSVVYLSESKQDIREKIKEEPILMFLVLH